MHDHWIVVSDASRARLFRADATLAALEAMPTLRHPKSRLHEGDLRTDSGGRRAGSSMPGASAHDHEAEVFSHEVADHLERGLNDRAFERLVIVAPPSFLGALRSRLPTPVARAVVAEVARDYTGIRTDELGALIRKHLPEDAGLPPQVR